MREKVSLTLCCLKREILASPFSATPSTPTLWNLTLCKPLLFVDWPFVTPNRSVATLYFAVSGSRAKILQVLLLLFFNQLDVCSVVNSQKLTLFPVNLTSLPLKSGLQPSLDHDRA